MTVRTSSSQWFYESTKADRFIETEIGDRGWRKRYRELLLKGNGVLVL